MTPEQAASTILASLWVQYGFLAIALIMGYVMLRETKKDKASIQAEKVELGQIIEAGRVETKQLQEQMITRADEHSQELKAVTERSIVVQEKTNTVVDKFVSIADECSKTRACKADQISHGQGG